MLTGVQLRMARSALRWSADELAERAGIAMKTVQRLEAEEGVPPSRARTLDAIQRVFETAGIEFIGAPDDRPGIRIGLPKHGSGAS
jgi:transcriptional regulator with XRE-family HTH domain